MGLTNAVLILLLSLLWSAGTPVLAGGEVGPMVAAAASLRDALPELAERFTAANGARARLSFGASGSLRRQIARGAPFELFLSADEAMVLDLAREGRTRDEGTVYAEGRLAILVPHHSALTPDGTLKDLRRASEDGRLRRLAIANPEHAPYGRAARETLKRSRLWEHVQKRLLVGENASQAAQFVSTGGADAGLVAYSLALSPRLADCCEHAVLPLYLHRPLRQRGVLLKGSGVAAERFFDFLLGPEGQAVLERHGFGVTTRD
jgi:molybdate transport system substrate-binding protein